MQVKPVNVKSVDRSVAQLRAKQRSTYTSVKQSAGSPTSFQSRVKKVDDIFSNSVTSALGESDADLISGRDDAAQAFMDVIMSDVAPPAGYTAKIIRIAFVSVASEAAISCLLSPREFQRALALLVVPLENNSEDVVVAGAQALGELGKSMRDQNRNGTRGLFINQGMQMVLRLVPQMTLAGRSALFQMAYEFIGTSATTHIEFIKNLLNGLNDSNLFIECLSLLLLLETEFTGHLLDLYAYYCVMGLASPSPSLCAMSVRMAGTIVLYQPPLVADMLPILRKLANTRSFLLKKELLILAGSLLRHLSDKKVDITDVVWAILSRPCAPNLQLIGLANVTPHLVEKSVQLILNLAPKVREKLLSTQIQTVEVGENYTLPSLHRYWDPLAVVEAVAKMVNENNQDALTAPQMHVLAAAVSGAGDDAILEKEDHWGAALGTIHKYVFLGLSDESLCDNAIRFVEVLIFGSSVTLRNQIVEEKDFLVSLMLLYREDGDDDMDNNSSPYCQGSVERLLLGRGLDEGGEVSAMFAKFLMQVEKYCKGPTKSLLKLFTRAQEIEDS